MIVDFVPDIFDQEAGGFIADIYVDSTVRRRGIGRALAQAVKDWFRRHHVKYFDWQVAFHNPGAMAFWRAIGGREVMVRMRADLGEEYD
jgi:GNAT superfamily N-acetyltransferase